MELKQFLPWLSTVGAAILAYWLVGEISRTDVLSPKAKRRVAYGIAAVVAVGAYLLMVAMQYVPAPAGWRAWVEALFLVASGSFGLSQLIHGERELSSDTWLSRYK